MYTLINIERNQVLWPSCHQAGPYTLCKKSQTWISPFKATKLLLHRKDHVRLKLRPLYVKVIVYMSLNLAVGRLLKKRKLRFGVCAYVYNTSNALWGRETLAVRHLQMQVVASFTYMYVCMSASYWASMLRCRLSSPARVVRSVTTSPFGGPTLHLLFFPDKMQNKKFYLCLVPLLFSTVPSPHF